VIAPYRNNPSAGWLMRDSSLAAVRLLKDGAGSYIFAAGTAGQPDTILGKPVFTDPNVAATAVSAKSVIFGDVSAYWVRYAGPVRFERSDDYAFGTDQVSFRCILRADAVLVDQTGAIKYFAGAAS
jgi:HK97 family phage major capsid protein